MKDVVKDVDIQTLEVHYVVFTCAAPGRLDCFMNIKLIILSQCCLSFL